MPKMYRARAQAGGPRRPGQRRSWTHQDYIYVVNRWYADDRVYLKCQNWRTCEGTARVIGQQIIPGRPHNPLCQPDRVNIRVQDFRAALRRGLQSRYQRLRALYDTVAAEYQDVVAHLPYTAIHSSMVRWRREVFPVNPRSLLEFNLQLQAPENIPLRQYDGHTLDSEIIVDRDGQQHLAFFDIEFVNNEIGEIDKVYADGTFKAKPRIIGAYQLFTLMAIKHNHAIPFFWCVMSRKTETAYYAVIRFVRGLMNTATWTIIMCDFELASRNAFSTLIPHGRIVGCCVHFARALQAKANSLGLSQLIREDQGAARFFKCIVCLNLLPPEDIEVTFNTLVAGLRPGLRARFSTFLRYFRRQWINIITPFGFSIFGLSHRSNNVLEQYHRRLNRGLLDGSPYGWDFYAILLGMMVGNRNDLNALRANRPVRRSPRYSTRQREEVLIKAWRLYVRREITSIRLLEIGSTMLGYIDRTIDVFTAEELEKAEQLEQAYLRDGANHVAQGEDPEFDNRVLDEPLPNDVNYINNFFGPLNDRVPPLPQDLDDLEDLDDLPEEEFEAPNHLVNPAAQPRARLPGNGANRDLVAIRAQIAANANADQAPLRRLAANMNQENAPQAQPQPVAQIVQPAVVAAAQIIQELPEEEFRDPPSEGELDGRRQEGRRIRRRRRRFERRRRISVAVERNQPAADQPNPEPLEQGQRNLLQIFMEVPHGVEIHEADVCAICHERPPGQALVPCGHFCLCLLCSPTFQTQPDLRCPVCRVFTTGLINMHRIFLREQAAAENEVDMLLEEDNPIRDREVADIFAEVLGEHRAQTNEILQNVPQGVVIRNSEICVVCRDQNPIIAYDPCGHQCVCGPCAENLWNMATRKCPMCRTVTRHRISITADA